MGYKKRLGGWGETIAAEYLAGNGYVILERNFRTQYGEIDLIALDKEILVFVEVKTRTSRKFGYPEEAISPKKKRSTCWHQLKRIYKITRKWKGIGGSMY